MIVLKDRGVLKQKKEKKSYVVSHSINIYWYILSCFTHPS